MSFEERRRALIAVVCAEHQGCFLVLKWGDDARPHYLLSAYPRPSELLDRIAEASE